MTREYVVDTHALVWSMYDPARLGRVAAAVFADVDAGQARLHVPAVVVAEV